MPETTTTAAKVHKSDFLIKSLFKVKKYMVKYGSDINKIAIICI